MSTKDTEGDGQIVPFASVLQQIARGSAHSELSTELQRLARAVIDTEKKGTITLVLTVAPTKGDALEVSTKITTKVPQEPSASIFFADEIGNLTRSDPRQIEAPLREVGAARKGEIA